MKSPRTATAGTTVVVVVLALLMMAALAFAVETSQNSSPSGTTPSGSTPGPGSAQNPGAVSSLGGISWPSPFTGVKPVSVTHDRCGTVCTSSTFDAGTPQSFSMTTVPQQPSLATATVFTDYFVVSASTGDAVGFSMKATNVTTFEGYFAPGANASTAASPGALIAGGSPFVNQTGNYETYSGSITAPQAGVYVFLFSVPGPEFNDSVTFLIMDSAAYSTGITIKVGAAEFQQVSIDQNVSGGGGEEGFGWDKVPITVYAPTETAVNLTSLTLNSGGWLKITPSYLPEVGPAGASATLYMVGVGPTTNQHSSSLFIGASGANGLTGCAVLPVESSMGLSVTNGEGPVSLSGGGLPYIVGLLYDPSTSTAAVGSSLAISVSIAGVLEANGSVVPLPSWLQVNYPQQHIVFGNGSTVAVTISQGPGWSLSGVPPYEADTFSTNPSSSSFSLVLQPYNPYYLVLTVDGSSTPRADQGVYTIVLNETVGGQQFVSYLKVDAWPLPVQGGLA